MVPPHERISRAEWRDALNELLGEDPVIAAFVLVLTWLAATLVIWLLGPRVAPRFRVPRGAAVVLRLGRAAAMLAAGLVALAIVGLDALSLLLIGSVFVIIGALAIAPLAAQAAAGLPILVDGPYAEGNLIELVDREERGFVEAISLRYTRLRRLDGSACLIPNGVVNDRALINHSQNAGKRRVSIGFTLTPVGDLAAARARIEEAVGGVDGVPEPDGPIRLGDTETPTEPRALVAGFTEWGVCIDLQVWVDTPDLSPELRSRVHEAIWQALEGTGTGVAFRGAPPIPEGSSTPEMRLEQD